MRTLSITRPDDWHVHFRDQAFLPCTVTATATHFARALVMPNLTPALTTVEALMNYYERINAILKQNSRFSPYMTLYLNEEVNPQDLVVAKNYPSILGAKLYPAGATTNSAEGTRSIKAIYPLLDVMQTHDLVLQVHGEVTYGDIFEREALFISDYLIPIIKAFPKLRIVLEHISTKAAVDFVTDASPKIAATITPHHLLYNRNQLLAGGIRPHYYCLPILKHEQDQLALQEAATSGNPKFFAGTDSAPHAQHTKESACGCAGIYSAPFALAMYTQIFDDQGKLNKLEKFMSHFGADFYQLPINQERIELTNKSQTIPQSLPFGDDQVIPAGAGTTLNWRVDESL